MTKATKSDDEPTEAAGVVRPASKEGLGTRFRKIWRVSITVISAISLFSWLGYFALNSYSHSGDIGLYEDFVAPTRFLFYLAFLTAPFVVIALTQLYFRYVSSPNGVLSSADTVKERVAEEAMRLIVEGAGNTIHISNDRGAASKPTIADAMDVAARTERPRRTAVRQAIRQCELEIGYLKRTANVNLFIGTVIFLFSIVVVTIMLVASIYEKNADVLKQLNSTPLLISKFLFSASFAAISFFFLYTYRNAINQVRHYRNEITNMLFWQTAMYMADAQSSPTIKADVIKSFLKTERNFVLKKGETTTETQLHKYTSDELESLSKLFSKPSHERPASNRRPGRAKHDQTTADDGEGPEI